MDIIAKTKKDIKDLKKIQGASSVAKVIISCLKKYGLSLKTGNLKIFLKKLNQAGDELLSARPTEPLAQNGIKYIFLHLKKAKDVCQAKKNLKESSDQFLRLIEKTKEKISFEAAKLIKSNDNAITHCHSSTVVESLLRAKNSGKKFKLFNTETRPLFQGHTTAKELVKAKIPTTMVVDSSAAFLISRYSGRDLMMDKFIIGCDAILPDGSAINKIGSFGMSVAAFQENVPVYIVTPLLKFYPKTWIKIEKRSPQEVWKKAPKKLKIINFAFDNIPAKYITAIITEKGLIKPKNIKKTVKEIYPWLI